MWRTTRWELRASAGSALLATIALSGCSLPLHLRVTNPTNSRVEVRILLRDPTSASLQPSGSTHLGWVEPGKSVLFERPFGRKGSLYHLRFLDAAGKQLGESERAPSAITSEPGVGKVWKVSVPLPKQTSARTNR